MRSAYKYINERLYAGYVPTSLNGAIELGVFEALVDVLVAMISEEFGVSSSKTYPGKAIKYFDRFTHVMHQLSTILKNGPVRD